jgi:hypothetical protein
LTLARSIRDSCASSDARSSAEHASQCANTCDWSAAANAARSDSSEDMLDVPAREASDDDSRRTRLSPRRHRRNESSRFRERCGFNISRFPFSRAAAESITTACSRQILSEPEEF